MRAWHDKWPYPLGVIIGFLMVALFLGGYRLLLHSDSFWGGVMIVLGLVVWPVYALAAGMVAVIISKAESSRKALAKALRRSIFLAPVGAVLAVLLLPLAYVIFGM